MTLNEKQSLNAEDIAYWFFRLNGCLNIVNFLVHHEHKGREGTDVDILAVRFPYRRELAFSDEPMEDHPAFTCVDKLDLIIAEVKSGLCALNGPWTNPEKENMHRILFAVGIFPMGRVQAVADDLYENHYYEDESSCARLFALGDRINSQLPPEVVQFTFEDILEFIYERLKKYNRVKAQHRQWHWTGKYLYNEVMNQSHKSSKEFAKVILK